MAADGPVAIRQHGVLLGRPGQLGERLELVDRRLPLGQPVVGEPQELADRGRSRRFPGDGSQDLPGVGEAVLVEGLGGLTQATVEAAAPLGPHGLGQVIGLVGRDGVATVAVGGARRRRRAALHRALGFAPEVVDPDPLLDRLGAVGGGGSPRLLAGRRRPLPVATSRRAPVRVPAGPIGIRSAVGPARPLLLLGAELAGTSPPEPAPSGRAGAAVVGRATPRPTIAGPSGGAAPVTARARPAALVVASRVGRPSGPLPTAVPARLLGGAALAPGCCTPARARPLTVSAITRARWPSSPARSLSGGHPATVPATTPGTRIDRRRRPDAKKAPPRRDGTFFIEIRRRPTLPGDLSPSTIGAGGLNGRVRDGNGCDPTAIATEICCVVNGATPAGRGCPLNTP